MVIFTQVNRMRFLIFFLGLSIAPWYFIQQDSPCDIVGDNDLWTALTDSEGDDVIIRGTKVVGFNSNRSEVLKRINNRYPEVGIKVDSISKDVIYLSFNNASIFTQNFGSTGALYFQSSLVFSLTEGTGPQLVYLNYIEGDHGGEPGLRSREYFTDVIKVLECK